MRGHYKEYEVLLEVSDLEAMDEIRERLVTAWAAIVVLETVTLDDG